MLLVTALCFRHLHFFSIYTLLSSVSHSPLVSKRPFRSACANRRYQLYEMFCLGSISWNTSASRCSTPWAKKHRSMLEKVTLTSWSTQPVTEGRARARVLLCKLPEAFNHNAFSTHVWLMTLSGHYYPQAQVKTCGESSHDGLQLLAWLSAPRWSSAITRGCPVC